jgi:hypothetical protein
MKVSTKIVSGIGLFYIIGLFLVAYQLSTLYQLQAISRELAVFIMASEASAKDLERLSDLLDEYTKKFFGSRDPLYDATVASYRDNFGAELDTLRRAAYSDHERVAITILSEALDNYWRAFGALKQNQQNEIDIDMLPPDLTIAIDHLRAQTEFMVEVIKGAGKEKAAQAAQVASRAQQTALLVGLLSVVLGGILAVQIVRSINDPLRLLTQGVRAVAKGQFWYRLPTDGTDEFAEVARDFNLMSGNLVRLDHAKRDIENLLKECPVCGRCYDVEARACTADGADLKMNVPVERDIDGHYRLLRLIGRGGMGAVYQLSGSTRQR